MRIEDMSINQLMELNRVICQCIDVEFDKVGCDQLHEIHSLRKLPSPMVR